MQTATAPIAPPASRTRRPDPRPQPRVRATAPRVTAPQAAAPSRPAPAAPAPRAQAAPSARTYLRRRVVVALCTVGVALAALGAGFGVGHASAEIEGPPAAPRVYVVQPGDTLWAIAGKVAPGIEAPRAVAALRKAAGTPDLVPGQRITLPSSLR